MGKIGRGILLLSYKLLCSNLFISMLCVCVFERERGGLNNLFPLKRLIEISDSRVIVIVLRYNKTLIDRCANDKHEYLSSRYFSLNWK